MPNVLQGSGSKKMKMRFKRRDSVDLGSLASAASRKRRDLNPLESDVPRTTDDFDKVKSETERVQKDWEDLTREYAEAQKKGLNFVVQRRMKDELDRLDSRLLELKYSNAEQFRTKDELEEKGADDSVVTLDDEWESAMFDKYGAAWTNAVEELADAVSDQNFALITDNHSDKEAFNLARSIMKKVKSGTLLIEAPNGLTSMQGDLLQNLADWEKKEGKSQKISKMAKFAVDNGWNVVPVDATATKGQGVDRALMLTAGVIQSIDEIGPGDKGAARQNFIAMKGQEAINNAGGGGIFVVGGAHVVGRSGHDVFPFSELVTKRQKKGKLTERFGLLKTEVLNKGDVGQKVPFDQVKMKHEKKKRTLRTGDVNAIAGMLKSGTSFAKLATGFNTDLATIRAIAEKRAKKHPELKKQ